MVITGHILSLPALSDDWRTDRTRRSIIRKAPHGKTRRIHSVPNSTGGESGINAVKCRRANNLLISRRPQHLSYTGLGVLDNIRDPGKLVLGAAKSHRPSEPTRGAMLQPPNRTQRWTLISGGVIPALSTANATMATTSKTITFLRAHRSDSDS
jgi:hypothetical protein